MKTKMRDLSETLGWTTSGHAMISQGKLFNSYKFGWVKETLLQSHKITEEPSS